MLCEEHFSIGTGTRRGNKWFGNLCHHLKGEVTVATRLGCVVGWKSSNSGVDLCRRFARANHRSMALLATCLADNHPSFATPRDRTQRGRRLGSGIRLWCARSLLVGILGKNEGFLFLLWRGITGRLLRRTAGLTDYIPVSAPVHHLEAGVRCLGIEIIAKTKLVSEFIPEGTITVLVRST